MLCQSCCKEISIFSVGNCNHPTCYVCATKLRVFQDIKLCSVCRHEMGVVVFTDTINSYENLYEKTPEHLFITKYNIAFQDDRSYDEFQNLIYRACWNCPMDPFQPLSSLTDHMREKHRLFCCEFCSRKIEKFSISQKHANAPYQFYKIRQYHIIRERYMSREDLFMHMLLVHRFCHICLAKDIQYVNGYHEEENLRAHFKTAHFLCEDGECVIGKSVFDSLIALRDHKLEAHTMPTYPIPALAPAARNVSRARVPAHSNRGTRTNRLGRRQSSSQNRESTSADPNISKFNCVAIAGLYRLAAGPKSSKALIKVTKWNQVTGELLDSAIRELTETTAHVTAYVYAPRITFFISTTAPEHMINVDDILSKVEPMRSQHRVCFAWSDTMLNLAAEKVGHLLFSSLGQCQQTILLTRVLLVPELKMNVLSAKRLVDDGCDLIYTTEYMRVMDSSTEEVLFEGKGEDGLWKTQLECHEVTMDIAKRFTPLEIYEVESEKKFSLENFWN